ncbi:MAG: SIS domain-containing protein, partial [Lachnospiraceae bacterium]|nr:SIS domain-containing protein [Lachnospiraceae bacterium]
MLNELITRYPLLESIRDEIERAYNTIVECYEHDGKVLIVGNGGSAADAEH